MLQYRGWPTKAHNAHPKRRTNEGAENYAKAIYELQAREPERVWERQPSRSGLA